MTKPNWDKYFLNIAAIVATRASCPRKHHGCVIVNKHNRIISTGYNGAPASHDECVDVGCYIIDNHCRRAEHAERNAIFSAAADGIDLRGATIYITGQPCIDCLRAILSCGIENIVYDSNGHYAYDPIEQNMINQMLSFYTVKKETDLVKITRE